MDVKDNVPGATDHSTERDYATKHNHRSLVTDLYSFQTITRPRKCLQDRYQLQNIQEESPNPRASWDCAMLEPESRMLIPARARVLVDTLVLRLRRLRSCRTRF